MIRNKEDLEIAYSIISHFKASGDAERAAIRAIKCDIRDFTARLYGDSDRRVIKHDADDAIVLIALCEDTVSEKEADAIFRREEYITKTYSPYDCTGKANTFKYKLFKRHGFWMAYHWITFDR